MLLHIHFQNKLILLIENIKYANEHASRAFIFHLNDINRQLIAPAHRNDDRKMENFNSEKIITFIVAFQFSGQQASLSGQST